MPIFRGGLAGSRQKYPNLWPSEIEEMAAMQGVSIDTVPLPVPVDQMLGAPAQAQAPDPLQVVKDKLLSVMTEDDLVVFKDMMRRVHSVMTADDMAIMATMASTAIEQQADEMRSDEDSTVPYATNSNPLIAQPGAGMAGHTWRSAGTGQRVPVIQLLDDSVDEDDEGIQPGYNAVTHDDAIGMVVRWLDGRKASGVDDHLPVGCTVHFDEQDSPFESELKELSDRKRSYSISARATGLSALDAMLSGAATTHYLYDDGRVSYEVTHQDIARWKLDQAEDAVRMGTITKRHAIMQAHASGAYLQAPVSGYVSAQTYSHSKWGSLSDALVGYGRSLRDPHVQVIHGPSYDEILKEQAEKRADRERMQRLLDSPNIKIESRPKKVAADPLTGVPPAPELPLVEQLLQSETHITEETLVKLANDAKHPVVVGLGSGLKITASPAHLPALAPSTPKMTATYVPAAPVDSTWSLADLLAEVRRTFDFCSSNWHPHDSKMASLCLGVLDVFEHYTPRAPDEFEEAQELCVNTLKPIHEVLAVAVPWDTKQAAAQYLTGTTTNTTTMQVTVTSSPPIQSAPLANVIFTGADSMRPVDRAWKLLAGHTYHLEDGSKIEIDATGNYTIHDQDATITYRAARVREFNRFINGSDLVGDFLETLAKLGSTQEQAAKAPLEMFIRWLVFKAAEHDHEEAPTDLTPITEGEVRQLIGAS